MKKLKNDRGVTLIILVITVIALLILTTVNINTTRNQIGLKETNNLYADIDIISSKVTDYYIKENKLPTLCLIEKNDFMEYLANRGIYSFALNINDGNNYYIIDLSQLKNLSLNYGKDYKKWPSNKIEENINDDVYIINEITHQIYYLRGIEKATEYVITNSINGDSINKSQIDNAINNGETFQLYTCEIMDRENIKARIVAENTNGTKDIVINTKVRIKNLVPEGYIIDSLEFKYTTDINASEDKYVKFSLNEVNGEKIAILTSNLLNVNDENNPVYLYIRALDKDTGKWKVVWQQVPYKII